MPPQVATRLRWGMVAAMPEGAFKLVLRKATSLTPTVRAKEELLLEYKQAIINYQDGTFTFEEKEGADGQKLSDGTVTEEDDEVRSVTLSLNALIRSSQTGRC